MTKAAKSTTKPGKKVVTKPEDLDGARMGKVKPAPAVKSVMVSAAGPVAKKAVTKPKVVTALTPAEISKKPIDREIKPRAKKVSTPPRKLPKPSVTQLSEKKVTPLSVREALVGKKVVEKQGELSKVVPKKPVAKKASLPFNDHPAAKAAKKVATKIADTVKQLNGLSKVVPKKAAVKKAATVKAQPVVKGQRTKEQVAADAKAFLGSSGSLARFAKQALKEGYVVTFTAIVSDAKKQ